MKRSLALQSMAGVFGLMFVTSIFAASPITFYEYDAQGNLRKVRNVMSQTTGAERVTENGYDALNRLNLTTYPAALPGLPTTSVYYGYDGQNQLLSVRDPKLNTTSYAVDGLGNQTEEISPDRRTTDQTFDTAGNLKSRTDARPELVKYQYDTLNRLTKITPADNKLVVFTYDEGPNAIGRLSSVTFTGGSTTYAYDPHGHVTQKIDAHTSGPSFNVLYTWNDETGRLESITYPSGKKLAFGYDASGRVSEISVNGIPVAQNIQYQPFGPPASWSWGNGAQNTRSFDTDGRMKSFLAGPGEPRVIEYDDAGRIVQINHPDPAKANHNQSIGYDTLDRLTGWSKDNNSRGYTYDANGNREALTISGTAYGYVNATSSNRIKSAAGPAPARTFTHDLAGNITADTQVTYTYNDLGRMVKAVKGSAITKYTYDGIGQRVKKEGAEISYYVYDESGHLIGSYDTNGAPVQEYVYLGDMPITVLTGTTTPIIYYVYTDQIMKPWTVTDVFNQVVWKWDTSPFGEATANQNPAGLGTFTFNLRFPGQHYDKETGLFYNYFRDYDPQTGRYIESDPIGLAGGMNTFAYSNLQPLNAIDRFGLQTSYLANSSCGAEGGEKFPNNFPGFSFEAACRNHDICYSTCGRSKGTCDGEFYLAMRQECTRIPLYLAIFGNQAKACVNNANIYYSAVRFSEQAEEAYKNAQCKAGCKQ